LKALSGRLSHDKCLSGSIRYNGRTGAENLANGVYPSRLLAYVAQADLLFPVLTVKETLQFAAASSLPDASLLLDTPGLSEAQRQSARWLAQGSQQQQANDRADALIQMLGLAECQDTLVGNEIMRGVSGGQKV